MTTEKMLLHPLLPCYLLLPPLSWFSMVMQAQMQNVQPLAPPPPPRDRLGDFQRTKPPTLSHIVDLMDAEDWLKSVEMKLQVVQCNNCEVLLASHQLSGPVADWWDAYMKAHEEPESINRPEFRAAFRAHHVPQGVIKLKKMEF
jgi:hypothetical protein